MLAAASTAMTFAGKPPSPPPVPPTTGAVFFDHAAQKAMRWDGTQKTTISPDPYQFSGQLEAPSRADFVPSNGLYGAATDWARDRLWLGVVLVPLPGGTGTNYELCAFRQVAGVTKRCQITSLGPGWSFAPGYYQAAWSNSGDPSGIDRFVSAWAELNNGTNYPGAIIRVWVTGAEINAALDANQDFKFTAADFGGRLQQIPAGAGAYPEVQGHTWSRDGNQVAYALFYNSTSSSTVCVADAATGAAQVVFTGSTSVNQISWSPDGARLAFSHDRSIWTISPDGSNPQQPYAYTTSANTYTKYDSPYWSPDSSQLVFRVITPAKVGFNTQIARGLSTGGSTVSLTSDLPAGDRKYLQGWTP